MYHVLIVEDHESMREALTMAYTASRKFQICGELSNADFSELYCEKLHPDLVLMDICTDRGASGLTAAQQIHEHFPEIKVIVMTGFDELSYVSRAKAVGASGFIYKSKSLSFFVEVSLKVMNGETYFPEPKSIPMPSGEIPLTDREMEVLRLICKHMSNQEIAEELFISENTVKYHKSNMLAKTGFKKTVDLAFYMLSNGWINPLY